MILGAGPAKAGHLAPPSPTHSTRRGNQTLGKQLIDSTAKLGGLALAIWTATWWWG